MTTHEERVWQSFSKQAFMSLLGAGLPAVVQGRVEIRLPFRQISPQQNSYLRAGAMHCGAGFCLGLCRPNRGTDGERGPRR